MGSSAIEALSHIEVNSARNLGGGQSIVSLEVDGVRVLVGVSQGRMDVLHTWDHEKILGDPDLLSEEVFDPGLILDQARQVESSDTPVFRPAPRPSVQAPGSPTARELVSAFSKAQGSDRLAAGESAPWWLDGASTEERRRLGDPPKTYKGAVAESVISRLREVRGREEFGLDGADRIARTQRKTRSKTSGPAVRTRAARRAGSRCRTPRPRPGSAPC